MENYRLKSKVVVAEKEYLVQTAKEQTQDTIISSLFVNGEILEITRVPISLDLSEEELQSALKNIHEEKKNELERLLASFQKVISSGDVDLMHNLGTAFYYKRLYAEARTLFTTVLKLKPDHHQTANYLGLTLMEAGEPDEAVKVLARAVELQSGYADYRNNSGEALLEAGFCRRAVEEFEASLKLNIYYGDAYFNLGIAHVVNGIKKEDYDMYANLLEKASDIFNRAALITPEYKTAQFDEAMEVLKQGDLPRALTLFKAVRSSKKEAYRLEYSGFYLRFLLLSDKAGEKTIAGRIKFLREEINRNPNYVDLRYELALCYLQQAQSSWQEGIRQFKKSIDINPRLKKADFGLNRAEEFAKTMHNTLTEIAKAQNSQAEVSKTGMI